MIGREKSGQLRKVLQDHHILPKRLVSRCQRRGVDITSNFAAIDEADLPRVYKCVEEIIEEGDYYDPVWEQEIS